MKNKGKDDGRTNTPVIVIKIQPAVEDFMQVKSGATRIDSALNSEEAKYHHASSPRMLKMPHQFKQDSEIVRARK